MNLIYTTLLLALALVASHAATITGGILAAADTTGTNARPYSVTITGGTNLQAGTLTATNSVTVGQSGTAGSLTLYDDDATAHHRRVAAATITTDINDIGPAAPYTGLTKRTITSTTNWTDSAAVPGTDYQAPFTTGAGVTNIANVLSANLEASSNITFTTNSNGQISIASSGSVPSSSQYYGASLVPWLDTNNAISVVWRKRPMVEEFEGGATTHLGSGVAFNTGAVSVPAVGVDALEAGIGSLSTGSTTNGGGVVSGATVSLASVVFTTNSMAVMWRIKTPSALSSDVDVYNLQAGLSDQANNVSEPSDGAIFYYTHGVSNGVWTGRTYNNGSSTFATGAPTTITVAVDTWYNLLIEGTQDRVDFYISSDDGATWTFIGRSTATIPNTIARATGVAAKIVKMAGSTGTATRIMYVGRFEFWPQRFN